MKKYSKDQRELKKEQEKTIHDLKTQLTRLYIIFDKRKMLWFFASMAGTQGQDAFIDPNPLKPEDLEFLDIIDAKMKAGELDV